MAANFIWVILDGGKSDSNSSISSKRLNNFLLRCDLFRNAGDGSESISFSGSFFVRICDVCLVGAHS